ncbi:MAG: hypothetical protein J6T80_05095 [Paludibacteraceae bacterium]|nr:hypothetical protein [Paludibacteraceae bacterium]
MKLTQEQIDRIHKISDWCIKSIILVGLVVLFLKPGNWFWWVAGISLLVAIVVNTIFAHWTTDEEAEQRKAEIKEAIQEMQETEKKERRKIPSDERVKSPLKGLTPQQEQVIIDILCKKILVANGHLKTSELKHLLKALALDGNLDDHDLDRVIAWVEQETGEKVDSRNLKYDYEAKISDKEVTKWGDMIRERFELIEIS